MATPVTDPAILALLEPPDEKKVVPVTDPAILAQLEGKPAKEEKGTFQTIREAVHSPTRILENAYFMGLGDRARAGMDAIIGKGDYGSNLKNEQAQTGQFEADHPLASPVISGVGGVAAPLGMIGAAGKAATTGGKMLLGSLVGGGIGGLQGGLSSKDWTDVGQTAKDTGVGVGVGGLLGGSIPLVGKAASAGYKALADALSKPEGISRGASRHLIEALQADGIPRVQSELDRLGPDAVLGDTGPAMLGKLQGSVLNSDEGRSIGITALTDRNTGTNARIMSDTNRALGPAEDPQTVTNAIRARRSEIDSKAYPAALDNAPEVKTAHILTSLDNAITNSVGMEKKALTNLKGMLTKTEQKPLLDSEGYPQYDRLGNERFQETSVSQNDANVLHKVKGELDNVIQYDAPGLGVPAGALTRQQAALKSFRNELNKTLEDQVPGYAAANRESAALAKRGEAVEAGTQYLGSGKTTPSPDRFAAEFDPLSQGEKIAFAKGSRGNIERVLGTKANDLQALRGELQGEGGWNTAKIGTVHGQEAADELAASVDRNLKFRDTYNKVVENSQTAQRQAAARAMKPEPSSETPLIFPGSTVAGVTSTVAKKAFAAALNAVRPDPTKSFGEVARILSAQGSERDRHLLALVDALSRRQGNAALAPQIGDRAALVAALLGNGYAQSHPTQNQLR
ncbi:hypothetical protein AAFG22_14850 [Bradyrhizobium sp. B024]|uniref:hypothetical protein n=1 Tax=Bradyrhizobium sp. B024 TaxID=3140247 RepID=UPI003184315E